MAGTMDLPIACSDIGSRGNMSCCYLNDQNSSICRSLFPPVHGVLENGCLTDNCINNCDPIELYNTSLQQTGIGNGVAAIWKYKACANIPTIAGYASQGLLSPSINRSIQNFITPQTSEGNLQRVTAAVTDCISSTCRVSRNSKFCYDDCSPVMLLRNNTSPNLEGIHRCLNVLCADPMKSLPWADADVIGIGVGTFD